MTDAPAQNETDAAVFAQARRRVAEHAETSDSGRGAPLSPAMFTSLVRLAEFAMLAALGVMVFHTYPGIAATESAQYYVTIALVPIIAAAVFHRLGFYATTTLRAPLRHGPRIAIAWLSMFPLVLAIGFLLKLEHNLSRVWLMAWLLVSLGGMVVLRWQVAKWIGRLSRNGRFERRTVIVGGGPAGAELLTLLSKQENSDLIIYGVFDDRTDERSPHSVAGYPKLGVVDDLIEFARTVRIDLVIFTLPITAEQRLQTMLRKLWVLPVDIRLSAHTNKVRLHPRAYSYIGDVPVLDVFDKPIADWDIVLKMVFDRVVGTLALILVSPIILGAALAVKLDSPGPVFFRQKRYGFNNELIEVYKLRSMYVDQLDATASKLVTRGDPRVTRVGRFIRKTSIDELPQLLNVVFHGDLSLVGPRPHAVHAKAADKEYDDVVDGYFARHRVRPGITGWAQVNGWRGETDTPEKIQQRVEHDLYYIENWSIMFDIYILAATPFALLKSENAF
ncbi:MAG: undecaprenyl-phosphate glucose phosphotransferase [Hyphomicrobiales bacterium]|nr:undecaprenyl-phosphate glucose phosphotransferase [Hyphomicrobiales bacterium]